MDWSSDEDSDFDILSKLGHALEAGSIESWDDTSTAHEIIGRITENIEELADDDNHTVMTPSVFDDDDDDFFVQDDQGQEQENYRVDMMDRPTPYEMWQKKRQRAAKRKKANVRLKGKEWDDLVGRLHHSNRYQDSIVMKSQQNNLADMYRQWTFKPKLNNRTHKLTANMEGQLKRQEAARKRREEFLKEEKKRQQDAELEECSFAPHIHGRERSEKILSRANRGALTPEEHLEFWNSVQEKREARSTMLEAIQEREYSFTPTLNRRSLQLQEKMKKSGRIVTDSKSGQTIVVPRVKPTQEDTSFHPEVSSRAVVRRGDENKSVHDRLYESAVDQVRRAHSKQIEVLQNSFNGIKPRKYEVEREYGSTRKKESDEESLLVTPPRQRMQSAQSHELGEEEDKDDLDEPEEGYFCTIPYSRGLDFILESMNEIWLARVKARMFMAEL